MINPDLPLPFRIFISYRREDTAGHAGRIYDSLVAHYGEDSVFMDIDTIRPGSDFTEVLNDALDQSHVLLALIGRTWLGQADQPARRRLDSPHDFVRRELETGLRRRITIIPLLVQGAPMPTRDQLPDALRPLATRQAMELSDRRWRSDIRALLEELDRLRREQIAQATRNPPADPLDAANPREPATTSGVSTPRSLHAPVDLDRSRRRPLASSSATKQGTGPDAPVRLPARAPATFRPRSALTITVIVLFALVWAGVLAVTGQLGGSPTQDGRVVVSPPDPALLHNAVASGSRDSVLKVRSSAPRCPKQRANSGFVIAPELVITTATSVAGAQEIGVEVVVNKRITTVTAQVVNFDPDLDVAMLRVPGLVAKPLNFAVGAAGTGDDAIVLGYPLDGPYAVVPARVRQRISQVGPDIYGNGQISRDSYVLRATVRTGTAGGPVITPDGAVIGMVFAASLDDPETGFALTADQVNGIVSAAASQVGAVDTGGCLSDPPATQFVPLI